MTLFIFRLSTSYGSGSVAVVAESEAVASSMVELQLEDSFEDWEFELAYSVETVSTETGVVYENTYSE